MLTSLFCPSSVASLFASRSRRLAFNRSSFANLGETPGSPGLESMDWRSSRASTSQYRPDPTDPCSGPLLALAIFTFRGGPATKATTITVYQPIQKAQRERARDGARWTAFSQANAGTFCAQDQPSQNSGQISQ